MDCEVYLQGSGTKASRTLYSCIYRRFARNARATCDAAKRHSVCLYVCVGLADTHFLLPLLHRSSTGALSSSSTAVATVLWATQNIVSNFATFICCHCCSYCFYVFVLIKITNFLCTLSGGRGNCKVWQTHIAWVPFGGCSPIEANVRVPAN